MRLPLRPGAFAQPTPLLLDGPNWNHVPLCIRWRIAYGGQSLIPRILVLALLCPHRVLCLPTLQNLPVLLLSLSCSTRDPVLCTVYPAWGTVCPPPLTIYRKKHLFLPIGPAQFQFPGLSWLGWSAFPQSVFLRHGLQLMWRVFSIKNTGQVHLVTLHIQGSAWFEWNMKQ